MLSSLRPRSIYDVCSAIACAVALLGGTAYAAATITGADVVNSSLTGSDVKGSAATSTSPAVDGSLTGWDLKDGSVTGRDVAESTLDLRASVTTVLAAGENDVCDRAAPETGRFCGGALATSWWLNYGKGYQTARFFKGADGVVHIEGHVSGGGEGSIFVLPVGYRPSATRLFTVFDSANTNSYVTVQPNGRVLYGANWATNTTYLQLDGISFRP